MKRTSEESSTTKVKIPKMSQENQPTHQGLVENNPFDMNPNDVEKTWEELVEQNLVTQKAGKRPFCCNQCNHKSPWKSHVTRHVRSCHYKIRDYKCSKCPQDFSWPHGLKNHVEQKHPKGSEESQGTAPTDPPANSSDHQEDGKMFSQIEVNNAVAAALVALKTENKKLRTEHDKMAETLKVSQEAHSQVVGEMKAEIDKLKSDLKKANEKKDVAMARLLESLLKREPSTTNQEK